MEKWPVMKDALDIQDVQPHSVRKMLITIIPRCHFVIADCLRTERPRYRKIILMGILCHKQKSARLSGIFNKTADEILSLLLGETLPLLVTYVFLLLVFLKVKKMQWHHPSIHFWSMPPG